MASANDPAARQRRSNNRNEDLVDIDAIVGTDLDQIAITPGTLWSGNGERTAVATSITEQKRL